MTLWPCLSYAQANYDGALIGGRSSLMGGTGVAAGTDAAALTQNPATTIDIEGTSFVFSTFAAQFSRRTLEPDSQFDAAFLPDDSTLGETQIDVLPNATCLFLDLHRERRRRRGAHKLSFCITEPERTEFDIRNRALVERGAARGGFQTRFVQQFWSKHVYSAGWAYGITDWLSVGITPMLENVSFEDSEAVTTIVSESSDDPIGSNARNVTSIMNKKASSFALSGLLGFQVQLGKRWTFGVSAQPPSLPITGSYEASRSAETTSSEASEYMQETGDARFRYPLRIAAGLAGVLPFGTFEFDAYFHSGKSNFAQIDSTRDILSIDTDGFVSDLASEPVSIRESVRPTLNVGFGVDIPFEKNWSFLSGVLTDFSGLTPRKSGVYADDALFRSRINSVQASLGVAWMPRVGSIMLGVRGHYGEGELALSDPRTLPTQRIAADQKLWGLALVLSGQLSLEMLALVDPTGLVKDPVR